ncbi:MAG: hypothetical protein AVDCRST_MAG86-1622 [uncultured Truepera sp.]|uniref:Methyltransferase domain-containing protein n=1 Tax=uncultured Truepera sp. TaxID=543023 RepID=A0A6J4V775_9DEIN|nr:MAG: hypothetical protein AVDCRST_MAG86-1622 [uncultured Truepera sp.]
MSERKALFDDWAATYDATLKDTAGFPFEGHERVLAEVVGKAGVGIEATVLDVGTGTGALAARLAVLDCRVLGVDLSEKMLARARQKVPAADFRQLDLLGDWGDLETCRFDAVVSAYVLHEFDVPSKVDILTRFAKLLEPGGRVVVGDISFETALARDAARQRWREVWDEGEYYWVAEHAVPALHSVGLSVHYHQLSFCAGVYVLQPQ